MCFCDRLVALSGMSSVRPQGSVSKCPLFLRLNSIPLREQTTFWSSIHPLMDTWVASTSWLLRIMLQ